MSTAEAPHFWLIHLHLGEAGGIEAEYETHFGPRGGGTYLQAFGADGARSGADGGWRRPGRRRPGNLEAPAVPVLDGKRGSAWSWHMQPSALLVLPKKTAADLPPDAVELHEAISHLVRVYQFRDRDRICCYDISVTQCYALEILAEHGVLRSQALADLLKLDKSTVTRVVDALVRKGYALRRRDTEDSRALALEVTAAGRALYEKIHRQLIFQQSELLADLDPETRPPRRR